MFKIKFRVYIDKYCRSCKEVHVQPTHRYIFHQARGTVEEVRLRAHTFAVSLLNQENKVADMRNKNQNQRPLYQYDIEVA